MRIRDPKTTALIFASGKMVGDGTWEGETGRVGAPADCRRPLPPTPTPQVCTGAKSEEAARLAARKVGLGEEEGDGGGTRRADPPSRAPPSTPVRQNRAEAGLPRRL